MSLNKKGAFFFVTFLSFLQLSVGTAYAFSLKRKVPVPPQLECGEPGNEVFRGCYFNDVDFGELKVVNEVPAVDFSWNDGSPDPLIDSDTFSVRWSGFFTLGSGDYDFTVAADDGIRLFIDDVLVLDVWTDHPLATFSTKRTLAEGRHKVVLEYYENRVSAAVSLSWKLLPISDNPELTWYPTSQQVRAWRGDIAMTDVAGTHSIWGTWAYACQSPEFRRQFREKYKAAGHTHVVLNIAVNYPPYPSCSYVDRPAEFRDILRELLNDHLIPVVGLATREGRNTGAGTLSDLRQILPELRGLVPAVLTAWELEVDGGPSQYSWEEHRDIVRLADEALTTQERGSPYITIEFLTPADHDPIFWDGRATPNAGSAVEAARRYYLDVMEGRVDALLLETGYDRGPNQDDPAQWIDDIGGLVTRLSGPFDVPTHWPWGEPIPEEMRHNMSGPNYGIGLDVVLFEFAAFLRWDSAKKAQWAEWAQTVVPRLSGYGDGGRPK